MRKGIAETKPCEYCGTLLTKTPKEQGSRKYWTCNRSCASKLRIQLGNTPNWTANPLRGQRETRPCAICGMAVTRYLSQINSERPWTCSRQCQARQRAALAIAAGTWKRPTKPRRGETTPCTVCGKPVYTNRNARANGYGQFCSRECHNVAQTKEPVIKVCALAGCGKELRLKPSQAARRYCCRAHDALGRIKRPTGELYNGRPVKTDPNGYRMVWEPDHPNKAMKGWQYEHRLIMERQLGRYLLSTEQVDHIDQSKGNNDPANLQVLTPGEHSVKTHHDQRRNKAELAAELDAYRQRYGPLPEVK